MDARMRCCDMETFDRNGNKYAFWLLEKVIKKGCIYLLPIPRS